MQQIFIVGNKRKGRDEVSIAWIVQKKKTFKKMNYKFKACLKKEIGYVEKCELKI